MKKKKQKRRKTYTRLKEYFQKADLAEMGSFSLKNQGLKYLLCTIDVFPNISEVNLRNIKQVLVLYGFIRILKEFKRKPNKLWIDQGKEF